MQPASAGGNGGTSRAWRRWGPIAAIVVVVAVVAGVLIATSGGGDDDDGDDAAAASTAATAAPASTAAATGSTAPATTAGDTEPTASAPASSAPEGGGEITYPLSFSQAEEQGIDVPWDERCDTELGRIAVPDYFAPECYAPFEGDNGGATATGVTADSIKVVYYISQEEDPIINYITDAIASDDTNEQQIETMQNIVRYYETYYELYGRSVELVPFVASGGATDEVAARADAVRIAEEIQPFVVWQGPALTPAFGDELAARGVLCISCVPGQPTEFYEERAPYVFAIDGSQAQKQDHVFEFISKQLIGQPASHAGEELQATERTFGLIYIETSPASTELANRLAASMEGAGAPLAEVIPYQLDPATIQQTALQAITRLKTAGVTTVIFTRRPGRPARLHSRGHRPAVLPRVDQRRRHARRHDGVRPHVRPGAVAARLRGHPAGRPARSHHRRLPDALRVVQRQPAARRRRDRRRPATSCAVLLDRAEHRAQPDTPDVGRRPVRRRPDGARGDQPRRR